MEVCILTIGHSPRPGSCQLQHSSRVAFPAPAYPLTTIARVFVIRSPRGEALRGPLTSVLRPPSSSERGRSRLRSVLLAAP